MRNLSYSGIGADESTLVTEFGATRPENDVSRSEKRRSKMSSLLRFEITKKRVPRREIMHFSRQLSVFIAAGIPILEALEVISSEVSHKLFKAALDDMVVSLREGATFGGAAAAHPEAFPPFYIGILKSAELTGELDVVLQQLSDYVERDAEARSKITSALVYPGIVFAMSIVTVVVLTVFVLPRFATLFKSLNAKLPLPTRILLGLAHDVTAYWYGIAGMAALVVAGFVVARRSKKAKAVVDRVLLRLPIAGDLMRHAILERVCRILAAMIRAGVSLPEAMSVTANATNNEVYRRGLGEIRDEMLEGQGLIAPLARTGLFPSAARQIFRVGEETGTLDDQLRTAAAYYERELDYKIKRFTSLFEPAVIIFMGAIVGFVAVALVSAMYGIYRQVKV
jgi:type IV pilus assembly protein PilC